MGEDRYAPQIKAIRAGTAEERHAALRRVFMGVHAKESVYQALEWAVEQEGLDQHSRDLALAALAYNCRHGGRERLERTRLLLQAKSDRTIEWLVRAAQISDSSVGDGAARGLALLDEAAEAALPLLAAAVGPKGYAGTALEEIGKAGKVSARPVIELLDSADPAVRAKAVEGLRYLNADVENSIAAITRALEDPDEGVCSGAADALGSFGEQAKPALPALIAGVRAGKLGRSVLWSLETIGLEDPNHAIPVAEAFLKADEVYQRKSACQVLAKMGPLAVQALPHLLGALQDPSPAVRHEAVEALAAMRGLTLLERWSALRAGLSGVDAEVRERLRDLLGEAVARIREAWEAEGFAVDQRERRLLAGLGHDRGGELAALHEEVTDLERELSEVRQEISTVDRLIFFHDTKDEAREAEIEELLPQRRAALTEALGEAQAMIEAGFQELLASLSPDPQLEASRNALRELGQQLQTVRQGEGPPFVSWDSSQSMMGLGTCQVCGGAANMGTFRITNLTTDESLRLPYMAIHALTVHGTDTYDGSVQGAGRIDTERLRALLTTEAPQDERRLKLRALGELLMPYAQSYGHYGEKPALPDHITPEHVELGGGYEDCKRCGQEWRDGALVLRSSRDNQAMSLPWVAVHALLMHGTTEYHGRRVRGDLDLERLERLLAL